MKQNNSVMLNSILIKGYKSIVECHVELGSLNVLIGANGSGKTNFISFFKLIRTMIESNLQRFVTQKGGPDALLHFGRKNTSSIYAKLSFNSTPYEIELVPTDTNQLMIDREIVYIGSNEAPLPLMSGGYLESHAEHYTHTPSENENLRSLIKQIKNWHIYHFYDTSNTAKVKQVHQINDNLYLREDGSNLAAFLYKLERDYSKNYYRIIKTIQKIAPFFGGFILRPIPGNESCIQLEWYEKGYDIPFTAYHFSDGTLRFALIATLLCQPYEEENSILIIDEPEIGLHPYAIAILGALFKSASHTRQIIISTQSIELVNCFEVGDLIVINKIEHQTKMKKLNKNDWEEWLSDYQLGELWNKNMFGGRL
ncbi:AAA family ATPase [Thorsellia anophelis]|uniref:Predicted ATPase n=1 Tax=Thorsellia anophelis DSM 18579 TaxID=1123402 RepID=A0A1I0AUT7_9GAMM|nr:AAA family ATPase [Thorsellia anophelis]SES97314.1 Predicted ATPase [Thorsellia anophelis DSM 18579]